MYVRTHPNDAAAAASVFEEGGERIVPMQGDVVPEINEVLASFDVLITDYSSVYYDYLMLDRPTIFLPYDVDAYAKAPGFYVPFDEIAAGPRPSTQAELVAALREACAGEDAWAEPRARVRDMVYARIDDGATLRVLQVIAGRERS
jgi:CDP-glycerol glycerophosphotransferase